MYEQEKIKPYNGLGEKGRLVERMFDSIAPTYDTLNHRLSLNIDKGWRKRAIKQLLPFAPKTVLDIATGTGDFAILAAQILQPSRLVGVDISQRMMDIGQKKVAEAELQGIISFEKEDCLSLSFADETFDAVTAAFGIRNFQDLDRGLTEMCRVLRKGGHLSIIELTAPISAPMRWLFKVYSHTFLPLYGRLISKDKEAYRYLTDTIEAFPQGDRMVDILRKAGFSKASYRRLTFGVCTMYFATK
ncbi:bifunctional demethylmenaquinone methyltransferase/2-methoxy-6-polyprenyl-1,4-benzoquinol methylase UbiE [Hoylesella pleuritidis]|uniref:bifunctional demethylmenaquinone methyltransferase/2-methoxy-6-polyprenyl-1,4-benzoquinol methylase UbiE n=1 Tax=Hoylesella pleuritidis TaxID=407975 RepID=UPI0028EE0311|nr:bifunctional demethylmenaquinone methyltransferase/2-methoxy-6-polyprenyl-1,4-benzoquinol methylase UbiE [Hoylesella pleuritidis]